MMFLTTIYQRFLICLGCFFLLTGPVQAQLSNNGARIKLYHGVKLQVHGDVVNKKSGEFDLRGTLRLKGDWTNNADNPGFSDQSGNGAVEFFGGYKQYVTGVTPTEFYKLRLGKSDNAVEADTTITIMDSLLLSGGVLITSASNYLIMNDDAGATGGNGSSFVQGPMKKIGDEAFTFPLGRRDSYQPLVITAPASATDAYVAEYFDYEQDLGFEKDDSLNYLSTCEFWNLNRTSGSSDVTITLGWNTNSCDISKSSDVRIAYWQGDSIWANLGIGSTSGDADNGTIQSPAAVTAFGSFTLASVIPTTNLQSAFCDMAGLTLSDTLLADTVSGVTSYEFYIFDSTGFARYVVRDDVSLPLSLVSGLKYGSTYQVQVRVLVGEKLGAYGDTCDIIFDEFAPTSLTSTWCDVDDVSIADTLQAQVVPGAKGYEFLVEDTATAATYSKTYVRNSRDGKLPLIAMDSLEYGITYRVAVRYFVGEDTITWGDTCHIELIDHPLTKLQSEWCPANDLTLADTVEAEIVPGALHYQFYFEDTATGATFTAEYTNDTYRLALDDVDGLEYGVTYLVTAKSIVGLDTSAYGDTCYIGLDIHPITKLQVQYCDSSGISIGDTLLADIVAGAEKYQFHLFKGGEIDTVYTRGNTDGKFPLSDIHALLFDSTYSIAVRTIVGTDTSAYGDTCMITLLDSVPVTILDENACYNYQLDFDDEVYAELVPGASVYQFKVENADSAYSETYTRENADGLLDLNELTDLEYNVLYDVIVRAAINNDTAQWGDTCRIKLLPRTQLITDDCDKLMNLQDSLVADTVPLGTGYEFTFIDDTTNFRLSYVIDATHGILVLDSVEGLRYNKTYQVLVRTIVESDTANYGDTCSLMLIEQPLTKLITEDCDVTDFVMSDTLEADPVVGATSYVFFFEDTNSVDTTGYIGKVVVDSTDAVLPLLQATGLEYGATYYVRVAPIVGSYEGEYGDTCLVTFIEHPLTNINETWCDVEDITLADTLQAEEVDGAHTYQFFVWDTAAAGTYTETFYRYSYDGLLPLHDLDSARYGITYGVKVATVVGADTSAYGDTCYFGLTDLPVTQLTDYWCDSIGVSMADTLEAEAIGGAKTYIFFFEDTVTASEFMVSDTIFDDTPRIPLLDVPGLKYATTYAVSVKAVIGGDTTAFGDTCLVSMFDSIPVTKLHDSFCDSLNISRDAIVYSDLVVGADQYLFMLVDTAADDTLSYIRPYGDGKLILADVEGLANPVTYAVRVRVVMDEDTAQFGGTCYLRTDTATQLAALYCDTMNAGITDTLYADLLTGATAYGFILADTASSFTTTWWRDDTDGMLPLGEVDSLEYGTVYEVRVRAVLGGDTTYYGSTCTISIESHPVTKLSTTWCDATDVEIGDTLQVDTIAKASAYLFAIEDTVTGQEFKAFHMRDSSDGKLPLVDVEGLTYGRTYLVSVQSIVGEEISAWGDTCEITLIEHPTTQLNIFWCDSNDISLSDTLAADIVPGASIYEFVIEDTVTGATYTQTHFRNDADGLLILADVDSMTYGHTYRVFIRTYAGDDTSAYGDTCHIGIIDHPTTQLQEQWCDSSGVALNDTVTADTVGAAWRYEFAIMDSATAFATTYMNDDGNPLLFLGEVDSLFYKKTYLVAVRTYVAGDTSAWGDTCKIRTPDEVPSTTLTSTDCSKRDLSLDNVLSVDEIAGATRYLFELEDSATAELFTYIDSVGGGLVLGDIEDLGYGNAYDVYVKVVSGADTSDWGAACTIAMLADIPVTSLDAEGCYAVNLDTTDAVYAEPVTGATEYDFHIYNTDLAFDELYTDTTGAGILPLDSVSGWSYGYSYNVEVRSLVAGELSSYGGTCPITLLSDTTWHLFTWASSANVSIVDGDITKSGTDGDWTDAYAISEDSIDSGGDGYAEFSMTTETDTYIFGLSQSGAPYDSLDHAILIDSGEVFVMEAGINLGLMATAEAGDVLSIERIGSEVVYRNNGEAFYNSYPNTDLVLHVQIHLFNDGAEVGAIGGYETPGPAFPPCNLDMNWSSSRFFNGYGTGQGNVIAESKSISDYMGRPIQGLVKNMTENVVLAAEPMYDDLGRRVGQTLPAPINSSHLCYKQKFVVNPDGGKYNTNDFDNSDDHIAQAGTYGTVNNPRAVRGSAFDIGTLGWYYSDNNTLESHVDVSSYPYSRVEYDDNNPGQVKRVSAVGDELRMGKGREGVAFSMPASGELHYVFGYANGWTVDYFDTHGTPVAGNFQATYKVMKHISVDPNGIETVSFTDYDGKMVAACRSGSVDGANVRTQKVQESFQKGKRCIDIHLPEGCESSLELTSGQDLIYNILDLETDELVKVNGSVNFSGGKPYLDPGFYRIIHVTDYNDYSGALPVTYNLNYHDFTAYYYDRAGRLSSIIPPIGIDDTYDPKSVVVSKRKKSESFNAGSGMWGVSNKQAAGFTLDLATAVDPSGSSFANLVVTLSKSNVVISDPQNPGLTSGRLAFGTTTVNTVPSDVTGFGVIDEDDPLAQGPDPGCDCGPGAWCFTGSEAAAISDAENKCSRMGAWGKEAIAIDRGSGEWCLACGADKPIPEGPKYEIEVALYCNDAQGALIRDDLVFYAYHHEGKTPEWTFRSDPNSLGTNTAAVEWAVIDQDLMETTTQVYVKVVSMKEFDYTIGGKLETFDYDLLDGMKLSLNASVHNIPGLPQHAQATHFEYNSLGQQLSSVTPDEGKTEFVYRRDGQIRFSQDARQASEDKFTYFSYDRFGRLVESGEYESPSSGAGVYFQNHQGEHSAPGGCSPCTAATDASVLEVLDGLNDSYCSEVITTTFDVADDAGIASVNTELGSTYSQRYLLGKVSKTEKEGLSTTWYSYDEQGRVEWTAQQVEGMTTSGTGHKLLTTNYTYNRSGTVSEVEYQQESSGTDNERFVHLYEYDKDNRLSEVASRRYDQYGASLGDHAEATYAYYVHGPLKRTELGGDVQGIDYTYNINGWLKAINHPDLDAGKDPGRDGYGGEHAAFGKDAFGMALDYYDNDYQRSYTDLVSGLSSDVSYYNGNIKSQRWQNAYASAAPPTGEQWMYSYNYDHRYWITGADFGTFDQATEMKTGTDNYKVWNITYDKNGNLQTLNRNGYGGTQSMDEFTYHYNTFDLHGQTRTGNRLQKVDDPVTAGNYSMDYDDEHSGTDYVYNDIGQLAEDLEEGLYYTYNLAGQVTGVYNDASHTSPKVTYAYDETGFRILKTDHSGPKYTWYARDASGNTLAIYERDGGDLEQTEISLYGSGRLGIYDVGLEVYVYELTDHLGNVRVTVSGEKQEDEEFYFEDFEGIDEEAGICVDGTWASGSGVTADLVDGPDGKRMDLVITPVFEGIHFSISTEVGEEYIIRLDADMVSGVIGIEPRKCGASTDILGYHAITDGVNEMTFTALTTTTRIKFVNSSANPSEVYLDNLLITGPGLGTQGYTAEILSIADYYPFGMVMPGAEHSYDNGYRYTYQGQEGEAESGVEMGAFQYRGFDSRLGRWMNPDQAKQFHSPYVGMGNVPIAGVDGDGRYIHIIGGNEELLLNAINLYSQLPGANIGKLREYMTSPTKHIYIKFGVIGTAGSTLNLPVGTEEHFRTVGGFNTEIRSDQEYHLIRVSSNFLEEKDAKYQALLVTFVLAHELDAHVFSNFWEDRNRTVAETETLGHNAYGNHGIARSPDGYLLKETRDLATLTDAGSKAYNQLTQLLTWNASPEPISKVISKQVHYVLGKTILLTQPRRIVKVQNLPKYR
ncbi:MAG: hypothetical protein KDD36_01525 [Flavobacteriales bacterium]|nr:hypothetical protein [Flavobacteriales bacterium]